jgi:CheY-like chemotaxis protein
MRSPDPQTGSTLQRPRLLLVEDDAYSAKSLRLLLTNWGYDVTVVATIAEATAALEARPSHMVLDLMLPDGDGIALLKLIRDRGLPIKVAITTGVSDPDRLRQARAMNPADVLTKPIDLAKLMSVLQ